MDLVVIAEGTANPASKKSQGACLVSLTCICFLLPGAKPSTKPLVLQEGGASRPPTESV